VAVISAHAADEHTDGCQFHREQLRCRTSVMCQASHAVPGRNGGLAAPASQAGLDVIEPRHSHGWAVAYPLVAICYCKPCLVFSSSGLRTARRNLDRGDDGGLPAVRPRLPEAGRQPHHGKGLIEQVLEMVTIRLPR
jgi:hypothetical protein